MQPLRLGVNIDHVATLRNARLGEHPSVVTAAGVACAHGADGITVHLREDRRHIRDDDVEALLAAGVRLNLEMAACEEMVAIAERLRPSAVCFVPERREEQTTEGGLDVVGGGRLGGRLWGRGLDRDFGNRHGFVFAWSYCAVGGAVWGSFFVACFFGG